MSFTLIAAEKAHHLRLPDGARARCEPRGLLAPWAGRGPSLRRRADETLTARVKAIHTATKGICGAPRIRVGRKRVARLMRAHGLAGVSRRRGVRTTTPARERPSAPDLVERDFTATAPDQLWVADITVLFAKTSRVLAELAGGRADGSWEQRLRRLARIDLLILDDVALCPFSASQGDDFYEPVSERAGRGPFILTANRLPKDWYELFPNAVVAEGVLDRLVNSSFHVHMEGKSYRPRRRPGQTQRLAKGGATE